MRKYSEEYYQLKQEQDEIAARLFEQERQPQRAKKFIRLMESYCNYEEVTPTAINEFISKIVVHERDVKGARYAAQRIEVYFNYIGKFENELTEDVALTEQECLKLREEIEKAKHEKQLAYHRAYNKAYRAEHLEERQELLHEFVDKIVVHEADKSSGHRVQRIDVHYNFIGEIDFSPEYRK